MENITMTIDAKPMSRVRSVCPEAGRIVLAGNRGWAQGTTVPAAGVLTAVQAPAYVDGFDAITRDLAFRPFGEPPV